MGALAVVWLALAGCGGSNHHATQSASTTTDWTSAGRDSSGTVWLCRPSLADNPCESSLETTVEEPNGQTHVERAQVAKSPPVDCFYLYPTVSSQPTANANLQVELRERLVATAQASRFSQVCRVYAPMYRQVTLGTIDRRGGINLRDSLVAYGSAVSAFRDYLAHFNHGRGIVFVGHSQGASILIALLKREVDPKPKVRRLLVSALLMGGNVTVPRGRDVGGDFAHIPACRSSRQTGCVVAYSSYSAKPPLNSQFGRVRTAVNPLGTPRAADLQIMCVNPASPSGGTAQLDPYFPAITLAFLRPRPQLVSTPWVAFPGEYTARCETSGGATWLQATRERGTGDRRPALTGRDSAGARPARLRREPRARKPRLARARRGRGLPGLSIRLDAADVERDEVREERREVSGALVAARVDEVHRSAVDDVAHRRPHLDPVRAPDLGELLLRAREPAPSGRGVPVPHGARTLAALSPAGLTLTTSTWGRAAAGSDR